MRKTGRPVVSAAVLVGLLQNTALSDSAQFQKLLNSFSVKPRKTKGSKCAEGKAHKVFSRYPERKPTHTKEMARRVRQMQVGIIPMSLVHIAVENGIFSILETNAKIPIQLLIRLINNEL